MGLEAECVARFGKRTSTGRARLEEKELIFAGEFRLRIPLQKAKAEVRKGELRVAWPEGTASFALGAQAEKWALKIRSPRGLMDKLGVRPGLRVSVLGIHDASFREQLRARTRDVSEGRAAKDSDLVFVFMDSKDDLARLKALMNAIKKDGAIWVVWPKGRKEFREDDVREFGPKAGLVDVKVCAFSDTLSALKMMIPVKSRGRGAR